MLDLKLYMGLYIAHEINLYILIVDSVYTCILKCRNEMGC